LIGFYALTLDEIGSLQNICDIVVYTLLSVSLVFLSYISWAIVRNVKLVFPVCQHSLVGGNLVHSLPIGMVHKIYKFYLKSEKSLAIQGDEDAEKEVLEQIEDLGEYGEDVGTEEQIIQVSNSKKQRKGLTSVTPIVSPPIHSKVTLQSSSKILGRYDEEAKTGYGSEELDSRFSRRAKQPQRYQHATLKAKTGVFRLPKGVLPLTKQNIAYHEQSAGYDSYNKHGNSATSGSESSVISVDSEDLYGNTVRSNPDVVHSLGSESNSQVLDTAEGTACSDELGIGPCTNTTYISDEASSSHSQLSNMMMILPRAQSEVSYATESLDAQADTPILLSGASAANWALSPETKLTSLSQGRVGKDETRQERNSGWTIWPVPLIFKRIYTRQQIPLVVDASQDVEGQSGFNRMMLFKSNSNLPWYFRGLIHQGALAIVFILCFCVWLVPVRNFPAMINTANLIRGSRRSAGVVLLSIFVSRELILADGFSRMNASALYDKTLRLRHDLLEDINALRFGGYIAAEKNTIRFGADQMGSSVMGQYKSVMYEVPSTVTIYIIV
jgi:hypothetical protein